MSRCPPEFEKTPADRKCLRLCPKEKKTTNELYIRDQNLNLVALFVNMNWTIINKQ